jgi:O-acetyl-ADP-ribose deacetylase
MKRIIEVIQANITTLHADAIVNAANNSLTGGGGVDGAVHWAAGPQLREYCKTLKGCNTGEAKITPGFNLPAKYIIHAVGPVWNNGTANEEALLTACYRNSLRLAVENNIRTIAFPCISTGAYRFPFDLAATIAIGTINEFVNANAFFTKIWLVTFNEKQYQWYQKILTQFQFDD